MENNKIIVEKNNKKEEFRVLLKVKDTNSEYIIYTKDELNDCDEIVAYAGRYRMKNGQQIIEPIEDQSILELLDNILLQIQSTIDKESGVNE